MSPAQTIGQTIDRIPPMWKAAGVIFTAFALGAATSSAVSGQLSLPSRVAELEATTHALALQVCLFRVEMRHAPNADECAGLR